MLLEIHSFLLDVLLVGSGDCAKKLPGRGTMAGKMVACGRQ
jgi:hypothetical protein